MVFKKREGTGSKSKQSSRSDKSEKKGNSKSDKYASGSRPARSERSSSDSRPVRSERSSSDSRPVRSERSSSGSRSVRSDRSSSDSRPVRSDRSSSDSRPARTDRSSSGSRPARSERSSSGSRSVRSDRSSSDSRPQRTEKRDFASAADRNALMNERPQRTEKRDYSAPLKSKKGLPREIFIWGRRTVEAFLENLHQQAKDIDNTKYALHVIVDKTHKAPSQLKPSVESAKLLGIKIVPHDNAEETWPLSDASEELNHQRVCLKIPEYPVQNIVEAINHVKAANENSEHGCIGIVLDQIQDPRNFGAIVRSAAFFGVKFVVYGTDRQADISSLVLKTSAGGAFSVSLIPAVNINRALQQLKEAGAWVAGTALAENAVALKEVPKDRAWVAVMGNEGKGLRNEVLKNCDYLVQIPGGQGTVDSLNVSVAAGIMIHSLSK